MTTADWVLNGVLIVGFAALLALFWVKTTPDSGPETAPEPVPERTVDDVIASRVRSKVIVTLKTGQSFAGVVVEADDQAWVLRSADALGGADDGSDLPVDGEIILLTADIAYAQKP